MTWTTNPNPSYRPVTHSDEIQIPEFALQTITPRSCTVGYATGTLFSTPNFPLLLPSPYPMLPAPLSPLNPSYHPVTIPRSCTVGFTPFSIVPLPKLPEITSQDIRNSFLSKHLQSTLKGLGDFCG